MKNTDNFTRKKSKCKANPSDVQASRPVDEASVERFLRLLATPTSRETGFEVRDEVVKRMTKGALGETLPFIAEHVRGRGEVRRARGLISGATMDSNSEGGNSGIHPGLIELEKAKRRLKVARIAVEVARREREESRAKHESVRKEKHELEEKVSKEREMGMLLGILESKETIRMKRIEEVKRMVTRLRIKVEGVNRLENIGGPRQKVIQVELKSPKWRPRHTRETAVKLHAHYIRLRADKIPEIQEAVARGAEQRLKSILQLKLQRDLTVDEIRELLATCKHAAEAKTRKKLLFADTDQGANMEESLKNVDTVRDKETKIIGLSKQISAKMFLAEEQLQAIKLFRERNADTIEKSLKEDEDETGGYVRASRDTLVRSYSEMKVREMGSESSGASSEQTKRIVERCQTMEGFVGKLLTLQRSDRGAEITRYRKDAKEVEERIKRMLKRKVDKARAGLDIVKDVEGLVEEARGLTL